MRIARAERHKQGNRLRLCFGSVYVDPALHEFVSDTIYSFKFEIINLDLDPTNTVPVVPTENSRTKLNRSL